MADNRYTCGYAKTARSKCKYSGCKQMIDAGALRIGKVHASGFGDGDATDWYHANCMFLSFIRARSTTVIIKSIKDIEDFGDLKKPDQERIKKYLKQHQAGELKPESAPKKKASPVKTKAKAKPKATKTGKGKKNSLAGYTIALSGTLSTTRAQIVELIEANGGVYTPSITRATNVVIVDNPKSNSSKVMNAKAQGKQVVLESWLHNRIGGVEDEDEDESEEDARRSLSSESSDSEQSESEEAIKWQWKGDDGTWSDYESPANDRIEAAYTTSKPSLLLNYGFFRNGGGYTIDLKKMTQTRRDNSTVRKIRRVAA